MAKRKGKPGDIIGPHQLTLLKYSDNKTKDNRYLAYFECPLCGKEFEAQPRQIDKGQKGTCGCLKKKGGKLFEGELIGPFNIKFLSYSKIGKDGHLYGYFECPSCKSQKGETRIDRVGAGTVLSCGCEKSKGEGLLVQLLEQMQLNY